MAATNRATKSYAVKTHGGSPAIPHLTPYQQLRRSVLSTMLFEDQFYEDGMSIADRIKTLAHQCDAQDVAKLAVEARHEHNLRHVSLQLTLTLLNHPQPWPAGEVIAAVISRADELSEIVAMYWKDGKRPLAKQLKKGLAKAFNKFDAYQLAKYDRAREIRLRDVLFLVHAKPDNEQRAAIWKQLVEGTLPAPDTWEVALSTGGDKKAEFERLIGEGKLGYLALLRNLRNMVDAGCDRELVQTAILARKNGAEKVLPFRYVAAARHAPSFERSLDVSLQSAIAESPRLAGRTVVMVDVSGSMHNTKVSAKSDIDRVTAAATLASMINADDLRVFSFANTLMEVPARRGMAGVDAIIKSQSGGTQLFDAIAKVNATVQYDRLIVITDEQDTGGQVRSCPNPVDGTKGYMINVASYKNGVGYGKWTHLDGFSERVLQWITELEKGA